jgi:alanine dehydrogenase
MKNTGLITHMNITKYPLVKNIYKNYKHVMKLNKYKSCINKVQKSNLLLNNNSEIKGYITAINQQESEDDEYKYYNLDSKNYLVKNKKKVDNNVTILTGGSDNIGNLTANMFSDQGAKVTLVDLSKELLEKAIMNFKILKIDFIVVYFK